MSSSTDRPRGAGQLRYAVAAVAFSTRALSARVGAGAVGIGRAVADRVSPVTSVITRAGWLVLLAAAACLMICFVFGWVEFGYLGFAMVGALAIAAIYLIGRARFEVGIDLEPRRVVAGERAHGRMTVRNTADRPSTPSRMELPVGSGTAEFLVPALEPDAVHEELFAVPTQRRAVIVAGPAISVRGDHIGLLRRTVRWTDEVELFVHPVTARLAPSAAGLIRDLEGQITKTITDNDISFHALRPYAPGDALRNVHWRTSARTGTLMVRQFEESRRMNLTLAQTTERSSYADDDEFELGVSIMASLALQLMRDGIPVAVVTEERQLRTATPVALLDDTSRLTGVERAYPTLREFVRHSTARLPEPSVVFLVTGSVTPVADLRSVETLFGPDVRVIAIRVEGGAGPRIGKVSGLAILTVGAVADLARVLRSVS